MDREVKPREPRPQHEDVRGKASIQHLYQLLGNNVKEAPQTAPLFTIDKKYQLHRPAEGIKVNLDYSRGVSETVESPPKMAILEVFHRKTRKLCSHKKKAYSVQVSNNKLKDIILGKRQEKKANFFNVSPTDNHYKSIALQKIEPPASMSPNRQAIKRFETDCQAKLQNTIEIDLNNHFQRFKSALKLKPIEYYIKKTKNSKFSVMGLSAKRHKKGTLKDSTEAKENPLQELELAVINDEGQRQDKSVSKWKIDSIQMTIADQKPNFNSTQISKLKKNSIEAFVTKCLPFLVISEHILWKLQEMKKFYSIVLLSFQCFPSMTDPGQLPKYHRKHVKYTYFVGGGNNRTLITQMMDKRWWWRETSDIAQANFIWTQQKVKINLKLKHQKSENIDDTNSSQQKIDRSKVESARKQLQQAQQDPKCKYLFESFESTPKKGQGEELQTIKIPEIIYNHMPGGKFLGNKKSLFQLLKLWFQQYKKKPQELFSFIPHTYSIQTTNSTDYQAFQAECAEKSSTLWIVKPGENSNRGRGIFLSSSLQEITDAISNRSMQGGTTIIQKYMSNLLFYHGRKFDIRTYLLCATIGTTTKFYWYEQGYLRTSSHPFSLKELSSMTHLTNDAIQSQGDHYGKYQKGNKLSYSQFQSYLQQSSLNWKMSDLRLAMKRIAKVIASASYPIVNSERTTGFQLFGMDFIVDASFKPWLLEVNTNPCLQLSCPLLQKLIPNVVQNVLRLSLDPVFPPNVLPNKESQYTLPDKLTQWNKFELLFDSRQQGSQQWQQFLCKAWQGPKLQREANNGTE